MPKVEIIHFGRDERGFKIGYVDFKFTDSEGNCQKRRNFAVFIKEDKKWISDPKCKREIKQPDESVKEEWVSVCEPLLPKEIYSQVLSELESGNHL